MNRKFLNAQKKLIELKKAGALRAFAQSPFFLDFFHKKFFEMDKNDHAAYLAKCEELTPSLSEFQKLAKYNKHLNVPNVLVGTSYKNLTVLKVNALNLLCVDEKGKKIIL